MMRSLRQHSLVGLPEVGVGATAPIFGRNSFPQAATGGRPSVTNDESHNRTGATTQGSPQPLLVSASIDKCPQLIQFQDVSPAFGQKTVEPSWQTPKFGLDPADNRLARYTEDALQTPQTRAFPISTQRLCLAFGIIGLLRFQNPVGSAIFAVVLRIACFVRAVLDDMFAATYTAFVSRCQLDQATDYHASLTVHPLPFVSFGKQCQDCPCFGPNLCTDKKAGRTIAISCQHDLITARRAESKTETFHQEMHQRAAIEGTLSELVRAHAARRARYRGLPKNQLQAAFTAAATNLKRLARALYNNAEPLTRSLFKSFTLPLFLPLEFFNRILSK
jgi:hypothetical protein